VFQRFEYEIRGAALRGTVPMSDAKVSSHPRALGYLAAFNPLRAMAIASGADATRVRARLARRIGPDPRGMPIRNG